MYFYQNYNGRNTTLIHVSSSLAIPFSHEIIYIFTQSRCHLHISSVVSSFIYFFMRNKWIQLLQEEAITRHSAISSEDPTSLDLLRK